MVSVDSGWRGFEEVNRVVYDPAKVSLDQLEQWLQESGTFIRTVPESAQDVGRENVRE